MLTVGGGERWQLAAQLFLKRALVFVQKHDSFRLLLFVI